MKILRLFIQICSSAICIAALVTAKKIMKYNWFARKVKVCEILARSQICKILEIRLCP